MKKHSLFKVISILLLLIVITTYVVAGREGTNSYLGLVDVGLNFIQSFYYFFDTLIFVLAVGGLYGVLNKTGAYKKLLDSIVIKVKSKSKLFIYITTVVFALIASLTGITIPLIVFVPFVVSLILLLGYDKLVAISSTVVAILIGFIGGLFVTFRDPSSYYGYSAITFEELLSLDKFSNILPKILLFVLGVGLLIFYISRHIKNVNDKKVKYEINGNSDVMIAEVKGNYKDIKVWPLITLLSSVLVLFVLGLMPWTTLFEYSGFESFHERIMGFTIGSVLIRLIFTAIAFGLVQLVIFIISKIKKTKFKFRIVNPILISLVVMLIVEILSVSGVDLYGVGFISSLADTFSGNGFFDFTISSNTFTSNLAAFGNWSSLGSLMMPILVIGVVTLLIKFIYKVKFDEVIDGFLEGSKKMLPTASLMILSYCVLVCAYNNGFVETIINSCKSINLINGSLIAILGSLVNVDLYYTAAGIFTPMISAITDEAILPEMAVAFQSFYGLVSIIGPTSLLLIFVLSYLDVPYTSWIKYIWRFILELFIVIFVVLLIVSLI